MKLRALKSMLVLAALVCTGPAVADDIFLKLTGIPGDSLDSRYRGQIDLKSYSQAVSNTSTGGGGGGGAGKATCGEIIVSKSLDSSSPALIMSVLTGIVVRDGLISFRKAGKEQVEYYTVQLVGVTVSSVEQVDVPTGGLTEVIKLRARQFMYTFRPQRPDGSLGAPLSFGFDCVSNSRL